MDNNKKNESLQFFELMTIFNFNRKQRSKTKHTILTRFKQTNVYSL